VNEAEGGVHPNDRSGVHPNDRSNALSILSYNHLKPPERKESGQVATFIELKLEYIEMWEEPLFIIIEHNVFYTIDAEYLLVHKFSLPRAIETRGSV